MKISRLTLIKNITIILNVVIFILGVSVYADDVTKEKKVELDWETKVTHPHGGTIAARFLSVQKKEGKLIFDVLLQNLEKDRYMCMWFNSSDNAIHIDDELGNVYKGGKFSLKPILDNKFGPNQKKRLEIVLPAPSWEARLINLHLGFSVEGVNSSPGAKCSGKSIIGDGNLNFHKLDWDISELR
ncbi:secreted protein [Beggiatoa sp. PS]|nr:secreted protein [Beggiatoa sp. PS]